MKQYTIHKNTENPNMTNQTKASPHRLLRVVPPERIHPHRRLNNDERKHPMTTATRQQVSDRVLAIVAELTHAQVADIKGSDRLREDLGLDSMQSMEMLSRVSEEFEVDPDMEKAMQVQTVDEVVNVLAQTIGAA